MSRRTSPAAKTADQQFPIRVSVYVPTGGLASAGIDPHGWLIKHVGLRDHALFPDPRPTMRDVMAVYFRQIDDAVAFLAAHPALELADLA